MISGIFTALLLLAFLGIWAWAWSKGPRQGFGEAALLPLDEDGARTAPRETHR
ncbi:cbb3-type cytochrome oxidase subunit 3 [Dokdonella koreensis]|uniref:Uncharacterized protein n=1 Tax=Dokdonella koreensis DS-123 TaxID=1300342 RepID=A0A160DV50_9GAMM|nr:CcoQ/FixQ family Cbb3-type cytochrome c oxidase assembly chaperone [Dokdonella koreensis]ANB18395.1 Hypothetical protein I596_2387 [Dokdonella koreensis DS-123]